MATNGNVNHGDQHYTSSSGEPPAPTPSSSNSTQKQDLPKDEVGWYFVEQYYTTLSKSPDKLHLFYGKQSQFVYGKEAELADVSVGRHEIQNRIKNLSFQDCKVRISNVDSQGSNECIVIQVIGETSNNNAEAKKFVQTFVLAQQPSGYFVLNDILRYINDDDDVVDQQQPAAELSEPAAAPEVEAETQPEHTEVQEEPKEVKSAALDTAAIDKKLEEAEGPAEETPTPSAAVEAVSEAHIESTEQEKVAEPDSVPEKAAEEVVQEVAEEEVKQPEDPKAPTPTPAATVASVAPAAPPVPAKVSWANMLAKGVPALPKLPTASVSAQPKPVAAPAKQSAPAAPAPKSAPPPSASRDNEWQTAENKRQNRPVPQVGTPPEKEAGTSAYVKFVTEKVSEPDLKRVLSAFDEITYCDINRGKNCAFIEFASQAGFNAAVAANPHNVNGDNIIVEQRRKPATYGGGNFNTSRGGAAGRGRGGFEPGRGGNQGGRGSFSGQSGRGGRGGSRGGRGQFGPAQ